MDYWPIRGRQTSIGSSIGKEEKGQFFKSLARRFEVASGTVTHEAKDKAYHCCHCLHYLGDFLLSFHTSCLFVQ